MAPSFSLSLSPFLLHSPNPFPFSSHSPLQNPSPYPSPPPPPSLTGRSLLVTRLERTPPDRAGDEVARQARLPRWMRQEIHVLIQRKRVTETRSRRLRGASADGLGRLELKWASVSSYCRRHWVNRGPVQCRKRWSNLAGDYKKIKEWEGGAGRESWAMRNDVRRERKLPGFFDREVYDILDRGAVYPRERRTRQLGRPRRREGKKRRRRRRRRRRGLLFSTMEGLLQLKTGYSQMERPRRRVTLQGRRANALCNAMPTQQFNGWLME